MSLSAFYYEAIYIYDRQEIFLPILLHLNIQLINVAYDTLYKNGYLTDKVIYHKSRILTLT